MSTLIMRNSQVTQDTRAAHRLTSSNMKTGPISRHYPDNLIDRLQNVCVNSNAAKSSEQSASVSMRICVDDAYAKCMTRAPA